MIKPYRTIQDVLDSPWAAVKSNQNHTALSDRVLQSTRLEDSIYADLREGDSVLDELEAASVSKLKTFPALSRDVYQSFYSLMPRKAPEETLSATARKFNAQILDHVIAGEEYPTLKAVCEGRELPAYEAAGEFTARVAAGLDGLLDQMGGNQGALNTLEKLEDGRAQAQQALSGLLERLRSAQEKNDTLEQAVVAAANRADSKARQVEAVSKMVDTTIAKNRDAIGAVLAQAAHAAKEKAEEAQNIIGAWSDDPANLERSPLNTGLLEQVRKSPALLEVSKYLGRFREIFAQGKKNGYAYGRGEKYSLELGSDLSRAITSELGLLATPETIPLFLRKYQQKQIKQYRRREPVYKGNGDIICCLDESGSTRGDAAAWGKAVAMTLLEIAADGGRKFALVHFSGGNSFKTDLFLPGAYTAADKLAAAETFLDGGTNFVTPLRESLRLMAEGGFENADIVFITDGECAVPDDFLAELRAAQAASRFHITGVLLDTGSPGMDFSLKAFCRDIYRTSQLIGEEIVRELVGARV